VKYVVVNVILHRRPAADGAAALGECTQIRREIRVHLPSAKPATAPSAAYCSGGFVHHDLDQYGLV